MTIRLLAALVACSMLPTAARADDVKEIPIKGMNVNVMGTANVFKPNEIKTLEELEKIFQTKADAEAIGKEIDFAKQKLVLFAWSGSGGDKLSYTADKDEVAFALKRGLTRDLRQHRLLFAMPKDAKFKVEPAK